MLRALIGWAPTIIMLDAVRPPFGGNPTCVRVEGPGVYRREYT
jgi:hypothetical protein